MTPPNVSHAIRATTCQWTHALCALSPCPSACSASHQQRAPNALQGFISLSLTSASCAHQHSQAVLCALPRGVWTAWPISSSIPRICSATTAPTISLGVLSVSASLFAYRARMGTIWSITLACTALPFRVVYTAQMTPPAPNASSLTTCLLLIMPATPVSSLFLSAMPATTIQPAFHAKGTTKF